MKSGAQGIQRVFWMLRSEVPEELVSDRDLLRATVRLVELIGKPTRKRKRLHGREFMASAVDYVMSRYAFRVLSDPALRVGRTFDDEDVRQQDAWVHARALMES